MQKNIDPEATQLLLPAPKIQADETVNLSQPQIEQQKALAGVIARIRQSLDLETIFKTTAIEVRSLLKADRVGVFRFYPELDWEGEFVSEDVDPQWRSAIAEKVYDYCFGEQFAAHYQQGKVQAVADIHNANLSDCHVDILAKFQVRANLIVPLLKEKELWGLLCIHQCSNPRNWLESEINFIKQIAEHLTVAIQQAEYLKQAQYQAEQQKALTAVIARIRESFDLESIFKITVSEVRKLLKTDRVAVFRFTPKMDEKGQFVYEDVDKNWTSIVTKQVDEDDFIENIFPRYFQDQVKGISDIYLGSIDESYVKILQNFQVRANIVAPLLKCNEPWGLLCIHQCNAPRRWESYEIEFVSQIAEQLGVAIKQTEYLEQIQLQSAQLAKATAQEEEAKRQKVLAITIDKIRQSLDIETIFRTASEEVRQLLQADRVAIYQFHPDGSGTFVGESIASGWTPLVNIQTPITDIYLQETQGRRYKYNQTFAVDNIYEIGHPDCHIALLEQLEAKAYAIAPILQGEKLWGLLAAYQNSQPRYWQDDEINLLAQVGVQLGVALQQAELLKQTRQQAEELSQTLKELKQSQTRLIQGEKMAGLGQLVAGVAHEINNPVNFIFGNLIHVKDYSEALLNLINLYHKHYPDPALEIQIEEDDIDLNFLTEDLPKTLASMNMGVDRIRGIVSSLRNFSRIDEAKMKPVDIHEGIDSTLLILQHRFKEKSEYPSIQVIKEYSDLSLVECYAAQLNQVFMNILSNGIDALQEMCDFHNCPGKTPTIHIRTNVILDRVVIRISDNGPGIPEDVVARIFDPFFTTKAIGKGTGLGLSISYQIVVEKHKGQLQCISDRDRGTEFLIEIPIKQLSNFRF